MSYTCLLIEIAFGCDLISIVVSDCDGDHLQQFYSKMKSLLTQKCVLLHKSNKLGLFQICKCLSSSNILTKARIDSNYSQMHSQKLLRQQNRVLNATNVDSVNQRIRNKLDRAKFKRDSSLIRQHVIDYEMDSTIIDCSVYGKAIKNCSLINDHLSCTKIMERLLRQISSKKFGKTKSSKEITNLNNIVFAVYFNAMSKADKPFMAYKYFKIMTQDLKIEPNQICFSTLIKSCRYQGQYELAETYWKLMENTYNVKPNIFMYTEMISVYSNSNKPDQAINTFNQCLSSFLDIDDGEHKEMLPLFGAYLNIFSRIGDLKGMNHAIKLIRKYNHKINVIMYGDLMRGCIVARKPYKAIDFIK